MKQWPFAIVLVLGACGPSTTPRGEPTGLVAPQPNSPGAIPEATAPAKPPVVATPVPPPPDPAAAPAPKLVPLPPMNACVPKDATVDNAQLTDRGVALCLSDVAHSCWAVDFTTGTWIAQPPATMPPVPAWTTVPGPTAEMDDAHDSLKVCSATPNDCKSFPVTLLAPDSAGGAVAIGPNLAAVWDHSAAQIFDVKTGKRVATIKAWPAIRDSQPDLLGLVSLNGGLGGDDTIELLDGTGGDSFVARLYAARTGKLLGPVGPMSGRYPANAGDDPPFPVAPHLWGFIEFEHGRVFLHDTRTGKLVRTVDFVGAANRKAITTAQTYNMMGSLLAKLHADKPTAAFVPTMPGIAPVATADLLTGKLTTYPPPICK